MARQKLNLEKHQLRLYKGDVARIQQSYPNIPYNAVIREIVRCFVKSLDSGERGVIQYDPSNITITIEEK